VKLEELPYDVSPGERRTVAGHAFARWHMDGTLCEEFGPIVDREFVFCICGEWTTVNNFCSACGGSQNRIPSGVDRSAS
jgi:hypothetical protein